MKKSEPLTWLFALLSLPLILLLTLPLLKMTLEPSLAMLLETICDKDVLAAMGRSIGTALSASFIAFVLGTPLAYLLGWVRRVRHHTGVIISCGGSGPGCSVPGRLVITTLLPWSLLHWSSQ